MRRGVQQWLVGASFLSLFGASIHAQHAAAAHTTGSQPSTGPKNMVLLPGGTFSMGAVAPKVVTPEIREALEDAVPIHPVSVSSFWMDRTLVTNAEFAEFVRKTGYVTVAERRPDPRDFPGADPKDLVPGGAVFSAPAHAVSSDDPYRWWKFVPGASWRHPTGPESSLKGHENDPVVQVTYEDAAAYARWAGKRLPTEAEWEFAARGGLKDKVYAWGDAAVPGGHRMANTYQGDFPNHDTAEDHYAGLSPVGRFPANGYGLYDMAGNVWEWVNDWYSPTYYAEIAARGVAANPQGPASSYDPADPGQKKRVQRGGSYLCSPTYCVRYMVGTRGKGEVNTPTNHVGFRCVMDAANLERPISQREKR